MLNFCKKCKCETERKKDGACKPCKKVTDAKWRNANAKKIKQLFAEYYKANHSKLRLKASEWRKKNPEVAKQCVAKWKKEHPEPHRIIEQNRRAAKKLSKGVLSKGLSEKLFILQKGKCPCCGLALGDDFHLDHIVPLVRGGTNEDWNIQLLRSRCNLQKSAKHPIEFMQSRGFLL